MDGYLVWTTYESSDNLLLMLSFYFLLLPIVYHVLHHGFTRDLFNIGQIKGCLILY